MGTCYLDFAATTPLSEEVIAAIQAELSATQHFGNPSAQYALGREARSVIDNVRTKLGLYFALPRRGFTFCSGATEANNTLILSNARRLRAKNPSKNHLITSKIEHPSVLESFKVLEQEGFIVTYLDVNREGEIELETVEAALQDNTALVSIMAVNNETGVIQDIKAIGDLLAEREVFFHSDIVQALGKISLDWNQLKLDAFSASAHKIYGPKGIGVMYQDPKIALKSYIQGGHQEGDRRAGTENTLGIIGLGAAIDALAEYELEDREYSMRLEKFLLEALKKSQIKYEINGSDNRVASIMNIYFPGLASNAALIKLDLAGIYVSAGSACAAGTLEPSHVLTAMYGSEDKRVRESLRISTGKYTTEAELMRFVEAIANLQRGES